jgi:hypothetical protein
MLQNVAALIPGSSGLAVTLRGRIAVRPRLAGGSGLRGRAYPTQFGAASFAGSSALLLVDNSTWPNVIHTAHANDSGEEYLVSNVNDGQCLVVQGPSLVGRATPGTGPAQNISFGGTLHLTNYVLADDQSALNANVATLQSQVTTLQGTEATDASNIATLQTQSATLISQVATLQAQVASLNQQVSILSATSHVGPLQATLAATSGMLVRPGVLALASGTLVGSSALTGDIEHEILMAAAFAPQPGLSASAGLIANISVRLTPGFFMTAVGGGPGFVAPAPMQIASGVSLVGFALAAQPAPMASAVRLSAAASNLLTILPGMMGVASALAADSARTTIMAPVLLAPAGALALIGPLLSGAIPAELDGTSGINVAPSLQQWITTASLAPNLGLAISATSLLQASSALAMQVALTAVARLARPGSARFAPSFALAANAVVSTSTFDSTNMAPGLALSNGNLTVTGTSASNYGSVRGTRSQSSGKRYFEVTFNTQPTSGLGGSAGVVNSSFVLAGNYPGVDANSWGVGDNGGGAGNSTIYNGTGGYNFSSPASGDVAMVAVDQTAGNIYLGMNGTWAGGSFGSQVYTFGLGMQLWPAVFALQQLGTNSVATINTGGSAFAYAPPSGYTAWG